MNAKELGSYITYLRQKNGYKSQRQLANAANINNATISKLEKGERNVRPETLKKLSKYLKGTSYNDLLEKAGYTQFESEEERFQSKSKDEQLTFLKKLSKNAVMILNDHKLFTASLIKEIEKIYMHFHMDVNFSINHLYNEIDDAVEYDFIKELNSILMKSLKQSNLEHKINFDLILANEPNAGTSDNKLFVFLNFIQHEHSNQLLLVEKSILNGHPAFAYKVEDNTMSNFGIIEGDTLICLEEKYSVPDPFFVIRTLADEIIIRKIQFHGDFWLVIAGNTNIQPEIIYDTDSIEILGRVIQIRRDL